MKNNKTIQPIIKVHGILNGSLNGVEIDSTVTGTANRDTGHVQNIFHRVDPKIGYEQAQVVLGTTIVCAHMAIESGGAKNLDSMAPMQRLERMCTFTLESHIMRCKQIVAWTDPNTAVVYMDYSGGLPAYKSNFAKIPDIISEFRQSAPQNILQTSKTDAAFNDAKDMSAIKIDIHYSIVGNKFNWSDLPTQYLLNSNNVSRYDESAKTLTYDTDVRMVSDVPLAL